MRVTRQASVAAAAADVAVRTVPQHPDRERAAVLFDEEIDGEDDACPAILPRARRRLTAMAPGAVLRLSCADPAAKARVPKLCEEDGHTLVGRVARADGWHFFIRRG